MTKYLVFNTNNSQTALEQFIETNNRINAALGYPTLDGQTLTYGTPIAHPKHGKDSVCMKIRSDIVKHLTVKELRSLESWETLNLWGWGTTELPKPISKTKKVLSWLSFKLYKPK
jgi:hypothetical protein